MLASGEFDIGFAGRSLLMIPLSVFAGVAVGVAVGLLLAGWFRHHYEKIRATEKTLLLLMVAIVLIGMAVDISTAVETGGRGILLILAGLGARSVGVWLATSFKSGFSLRERLFCLFA